MGVCRLGVGENAKAEAVKHTLFHYAAFEPGDNPGQHPQAGAPRFTGLTIAMFEFGLLRANLRSVARPFRVRYGLLPTGYIWRVDWDDEISSLVKKPE